MDTKAYATTSPMERALADARAAFTVIEQAGNGLAASTRDYQRLARATARLAARSRAPEAPKATTVADITRMSLAHGGPRSLGGDVGEIVSLSQFVRLLCADDGVRDYDAVAGKGGILYLPRIGLTLGMWTVVPDNSPSGAAELAMTVIRCGPRDQFSRRAAKTIFEENRWLATTGAARSSDGEPTTKLVTESWISRPRLLGLIAFLRDLENYYLQVLEDSTMAEWLVGTRNDHLHSGLLAAYRQLLDDARVSLATVLLGDHTWAVLHDAMRRSLPLPGLPAPRVEEYRPLRGPTSAELAAIAAEEAEADLAQELTPDEFAELDEEVE